MENQQAQGFLTNQVNTNESGGKPDEANYNQPQYANLLPKLLRIIGAGIIFSCASIFLFQRWGGGNDIQRYLLLLAFTTALTAGGFFCGLKLKESKGARTLLGLTLAVTPVNFAVLGGLVYSQFAIGGVNASMPTFATWMAPSPGAAIAIAAAGSLALAPLCYISFLTMGRNRARSLTVCYFLSNLTLLVPTRQPDPVGILMIISVIGVLFCERHCFRNETSLKTTEGRFARAMPWVPALLLIGRTGYFYYPSELFTGCIFAATALFGFTILPTITEQVHIKKTMQVISSGFAIASWICFANVIFKAMSLNNHWTIPLCTLPSAALLLTLSFFAVGDGAGYRRSGAIIALAGVSANLCFFPGLLASFICLLTAVLVLVYGYIVEQKAIFFSGIVGVAVGLGYHLKYALSFYSLTNWSSLAITGIAIIILASVIERNPNQIIDKAHAFRKRIQGWNN